VRAPSTRQTRVRDEPRGKECEAGKMRRGADEDRFPKLQSGVQQKGCLGDLSGRGCVGNGQNSRDTFSSGLTRMHIRTL